MRTLLARLIRWAFPPLTDPTCCAFHAQRRRSFPPRGWE
jgi:hypothetical protein